MATALSQNGYGSDYYTVVILTKILLQCVAGCTNSHYTAVISITPQPKSRREVHIRFSAGRTSPGEREEVPLVLLLSPYSPGFSIGSSLIPYGPLGIPPGSSRCPNGIARCTKVHLEVSQMHKVHLEVHKVHLEVPK